MADSIKLKNGPLVNPLPQPRRAIWIVLGVLLTMLAFSCFALALLWQGNRNQSLTTNHFVELVGNATSARITINPAVSRLTVSAATDSTSLFDADATYYTDTLTYEHSGDTAKTVALKQDHSSSGINFFSFSNPFAGEQALQWEVHLSPNVPLDLSIFSGVGVTALDLGKLNLTNLSILSGVGSVTVTLPVGNPAYPASIEVGVGSVDIRIQQQGSINLKIKGGVGSIHLIVPPDVGIRLIADKGLGGINVLPTMQRTGNEDGTYETPDFSSATHQISISYEAGVGSFTLTQDQSIAR